MTIHFNSNGHIVPISQTDLSGTLKGKSRYFLILDRDGTLVPIADRPEDALMKPSQRSFLDNLIASLPGNTAIVSARGVAMLQSDFEMAQTILAGNYGLELSFPSGNSYVHPEALKVKPTISEIHKRLLSRIGSREDLLLDYHVFSMCLHFHLVPLPLLDEVHQMIHSLSLEYDDVIFQQLPTSYDILPSFRWDKADALDIIVQQLELDLVDTLSIAVGDSESDEPMFRWVNERGGLSCRVGATTDSSHPQLLDNSDAQLYLDSVEDVYQLLSQLSTDVQNVAAPLLGS